MIFLDFLAAAMEFLCGIMIVSAFFPKPEGKEQRKLTAVILCGLIHILLSMFTNHWPMLPRMLLIILNYFSVCKICCCGNDNNTYNKYPDRNTAVDLSSSSGFRFDC